VGEGKREDEGLKRNTKTEKQTKKEREGENVRV
jgi:hypothetical protein